MKRYVYLAGPIEGLRGKEANDWRKDVIFQLPKGIVGVSPLRCEVPRSGGTYGAAKSNSGKEVYFRTPRGINMKNQFDVGMCDVTFAYLPVDICKKRANVGTIMEIGWGIWHNQTPTFVVSDWKDLILHPLISENVAGIFAEKDFDEAVRAVGDLLNVYTEEKRTG